MRTERRQNKATSIIVLKQHLISAVMETIIRREIYINKLILNVINKLIIKKLPI
jgi:hypothetical protein